LDHQKPTIDVLVPIWQRVLQRSSIGVEDNFFDLGGDASAARKLFAEIAYSCGQEMPPVMIYAAPTIKALAAVFEDPATRRFPALALLRGGVKAPPIFIAHGVGDTVMDLAQLARLIPVAQPIYGMQARGIDGLDAPFDRIEDLAQFFLEAIRQIQQHGPYILVGYSLGGLVALEIAQRFAALGEDVALLAMLDAYPHRRYLSLGQRVRLMIRAIRHRASILLKLQKSTPSMLLSPALKSVCDSSYLALERYRPKLYDGTIKFMKPELFSGFPDDPLVVWGPLARRVEVETVPGDHQDMVTTHSADVAAVLSRWVEAALLKHTGDNR
jgi:acetoacetyl-CoA synthetase